MAGNITKRGENRWQVRVFLGRDPKSGHPKFHCKTIQGTKKEAQAYLNKVLHGRDLGTWVEPSKLRFATYLERWLTEADTSFPKNNDYNRWVIGHYVNPALGAIPLGQLSPFDLQGFYNSLKQRGLAPSTIRRVHNVLSPALRTAHKWGMIGRNPANDVELPRIAKNEMLVLSPDEALRFLEAARGDKYHVLWNLALETGMRPAEYLGLRWVDLDLKLGVLMLQRVLIWNRGGGWELKEPKTAAGRRLIRLSDQLVQMLVLHRQVQKGERTELGMEWQDHDIIFPSTNGNPIRSENLTVRHFKPLLTKAGLRPIRLYDLRHSSATLLLSQGVHAKIVSERLGHADVSLTLNTYSHVLPDMQRDATQAIGRLLHHKKNA